MGKPEQHGGTTQKPRDSVRTRQQRDKERHEGTTGQRPQNRVDDSKAAKMIYIILATIIVNVIYKAREYGRADVADLIIMVAASAILLT